MYCQTLPKRSCAASLSSSASVNLAPSVSAERICLTTNLLAGWTALVEGTILERPSRSPIELQRIFISLCPVSLLCTVTTLNASSQQTHYFPLKLCNSFYNCNLNYSLPPMFTHAYTQCLPLSSPSDDRIRLQETFLIMTLA